MKEVLKTSPPTNYDDMTKSICSPALAVGPSLYDLLVGPIAVRSGPPVARANLSARQVRELGLLTSGTFGPSHTTSSPSAALQASLANRLQASPAFYGSTSYALIWKLRGTLSGPPICALRASARRISGSAFTGLPTPSGTSNHGVNHVAGRLDEWGGSSNPFRGTDLGAVHSPSFEFWMMGLPAAWRQQMPPAMRSSRKSHKPLSNVPSLICNDLSDLI